MTLHELRKAPHLSASGLNDFCDCSLKYKFSRIDRMEPEFRSSGLLLGSTIHAVLAEHFQALMQGEHLSLDELEHLFTLHWERELKEKSIPIRFKEGEDENSVLDQGLKLVKVFHEQAPHENQEVIAVEEAFCLEIPGLPIFVVGAFDLVLMDREDGSITIVDHKTLAKRMSQADANKSCQMTIYSLAAKMMGYGSDVKLRLDCLLKTKAPSFEQVHTTRTDEDETRIIKKLITAYEAIQKRIFLPNESWQCSGCSYQGACSRWAFEDAA